MKKQIKPNPKTNQVNEKNAASGIQAFFKSVPKDFVLVENVAEVKSDESAKAFYVDILKEKLRSVREKDENGNVETCYQQADGNGAFAVIMEKEDNNNVSSTKAQVQSKGHDSKTKCAGCVENAIERDEWKQKYEEEAEKRKALKKLYVNSTIQFSELHSKYNDLLKTATRTHYEINHDTATSSDIFTVNEVKFLQAMLLDQKNDCSFILQCLKFAYKLDHSVLVSRTLKGTAEWKEITNEGEEIHHGGKAPVTPQKAERIKGLFIERISKCEIDSAGYHDRIKDSYVNKLIAAGIRNISKKFN